MWTEWWEQNKYCRDDVGPGDRDVSNITSLSWRETVLLCETLALCFSEHEKRSSAHTLQHNSGDSQSCSNTIFPFLTPAEAFYRVCGSSVHLPSPVSSLPQPSTLSLKARHTTAFWWPLYSLLISPVSTHHRRARLSEDAVGLEPESVVRNVYMHLSNSLEFKGDSWSQIWG